MRIRSSVFDWMRKKIHVRDAEQMKCPIGTQKHDQTALGYTVSVTIAAATW